MTLKNIYSQTIVIANKYDVFNAGEETLGEAWKITEVHNAAWYEQSERTVTPTGVIFGKYSKILIPFSPNYIHKFEITVVGEGRYNSFVEDTNTYTMRIGDYILCMPNGILFDGMSVTDLGGITAWVNSYRAQGFSVMQVKDFKELYNRGGSIVQLSIDGV